MHTLIIIEEINIQIPSWSEYTTTTSGPRAAVGYNIQAPWEGNESYWKKHAKKNYSARAQHGEWSLLRVNSSTQEADTQLQQIQNQLGLHSLKHQTKAQEQRNQRENTA